MLLFLYDPDPPSPAKFLCPLVRVLSPVRQLQQQVQKWWQYVQILHLFPETFLTLNK